MSEAKLDLNWFDNKETPDPYLALKSLADRLYDTDGRERQSDADNYLQLYLGSTRWTTGGYRAGNVQLWPFASFDSTPSLNIIQAITDTMVGMTLRQRVRPFFITEGGSWEQRERAQAMQLAIEGQYRSGGVYDELGTRVCYDGFIFEGGGIKQIADYHNKRVIYNRVYPWQVLVPSREGMADAHGMPTQMFHVYPMPRASVMAMFDPDTSDGRRTRDVIKQAKPIGYDAERDPYPEDGKVTDEIWVIEGWHRPSGRVDLKDEANWGKDKKGNRVKHWPHDGRHTIIIDAGEGQDSGTILDEPWVYDYFPISFFLPYPYPTSFWSRSVPQTLAGLQVAMHRMNRRVERIIHLHSRPLIYAWNRANVNLDQINNDAAGIITGDVQPGQAIQYITPTAVPGELVERIREMAAWAKEQFGVSDQSIQANRPPGIEHAPAMQHLQELETVRHTPSFRAWERMHIHCARSTADMFRTLAEYSPDFEVMWGEDDELKKINWKKSDLGADNVRIAVYPTNLLPLLPGAKIERLVQMIGAGMIEPDKAMAALMEFPDIKSLLKDANSERRNIETKLGYIVKDGNYQKAMPNPYLNLDLAQLIGLDWINRMEADGLAPPKLEMLRRWHRDVGRIKQKQMMAQPAVPGAAPGAPAAPAQPLAPAAAPMAPAPAPGTMGM